MRIRIFGFRSDTNMPPSSGGLIASLIACGVTGVLLYQQIARPGRDLLMVLILSVVLLSSCYHVFYQARGLYRQKKSQSHDTEFMHRNEETSYEIPHTGENLYCPYYSVNTNTLLLKDYMV